MKYRTIEMRRNSIIRLSSPGINTKINNLIGMIMASAKIGITSGVSKKKEKFFRINALINNQ